MSESAKEILGQIRQLLDEIKQQFVGAPIDTEAANAYASAVHESQQKASEALAMVEAIMSSGGEEIERQKREIALRLCIAKMLDAIDLGAGSRDPDRLETGKPRHAVDATACKVGL